MTDSQIKQVVTTCVGNGKVPDYKSMTPQDRDKAKTEYDRQTAKNS